jgi:hypothetical protein
MLGWHHAARLMQDPRAGERARRSFENLIAAARRPARPAPSTSRTRSRARTRPI